MGTTHQHMATSKKYMAVVSNMCATQHDFKIRVSTLHRRININVMQYPTSSFKVKSTYVSWSKCPFY